jgi:hypothetical protein
VEQDRADPNVAKATRESLPERVCSLMVDMLREHVRPGRPGAGQVLHHGLVLLSHRGSHAVQHQSFNQAASYDNTRGSKARPQRKHPKCARILETATKFAFLPRKFGIQLHKYKDDRA